MRSRHTWFLALAGACVLFQAARLAIGVDYGLRAEYFDRAERDTPPLFVGTDAEVSTRQLMSSWITAPPEMFGVRWSGFLTVPVSGPYTFAVRSDAEATLLIDGRLLIERAIDGGAGTTTGTVDLRPGPHVVRFEYAHKSGDIDLAWMWAHERDTLTVVPSWAVSPGRVSSRTLTVARVLDWLRITTAVLALVAGWRTILSGIPTLVRRFPRVACLLFFVALTVAETWPLAAHPARLSRNDNSDALLNEWAIAWVAHQVPRDPIHLFDANIFHPDRNTLAYSESMPVQSAMAAPMFWLGASPVLAYNLVLLAGFALTGWAMCLVVHRWTDDWVAGVASGILIAFNAHVFTRIPHLQIQHGEFLPLALLSLDVFLRDPRRGTAVRLALAFVLQSLTSVYFIAFTSVSMIVAALVRPDAWRGRRFGKVAPWAVLAAVVAAILLLPFLLPYWAVRQDQGELTGALTEATASGAKWSYYLSTPSRIDYALFSERWFSTVSLFPGVVGLALTAVAVGSGIAFREPRARMALAVGVAGLTLSFGAVVPGFALLKRVFPPIQAARDVPRFGYLAIFAVALLAGFSVAFLRKRIRPGLQAPFAIALLSAVALEPAVAPLRLIRFDGIPSIYSRVRDLDGVVIAELPVFTRIASFHEAPYMLNSTAHWQPMINGYSGFQPRDYRVNAPIYAGFPGQAAIDALKAAGVTHIFVHTEWFGPTIVDDLTRIPSLRLLEARGTIRLYHLKSDGPEAISP